MDIINDDIFTLLGLPNISDDQKRDMITEILQTVKNRIMARLFDVFTLEERDAIEAAFSEKDYQKVNAMLAEKGMDDFTSLVAQEVMLYKLELVSTFNPQAE